jgi:DNA-binding GntR family transcriptional regulator
MRWLLEGRAAFLAAAYLPVEVIDRLQCCADKLDDDIDADDWLIRWTSFDDDFHISIAAGAQRPRLLADVRRYRLLHRSFRHRFRDAKALRAALVQHDRILKALRQRNANEAQQAMQDHVGAWSEHFANLVEQPGSES